MGAKIVPEALRAAGFDVVAMQDYYGPAKAERLADEDWIPDVTRAGMAVLTKDSKMRFNRLIVDAIIGSGARCFALARQDLTGRQMAQQLIGNKDEIIRLAQTRPGPYFFHVHQDRVDDMPLITR
jgi:PIN like domain